MNMKTYREPASHLVQCFEGCGHRDIEHLDKAGTGGGCCPVRSRVWDAKKALEQQGLEHEFRMHTFWCNTCDAQYAAYYVRVQTVDGTKDYEVGVDAC